MAERGQIAVTKFEDIMLTLFDQEKIWNIERDNIRAAALADGSSQGAAEKEKI